MRHFDEAKETGPAAAAAPRSKSKRLGSATGAEVVWYECADVFRPTGGAPVGRGGAGQCRTSILVAWVLVGAGGGVSSCGCAVQARCAQYGRPAEQPLCPPPWCPAGQTFRYWWNARTGESTYSEPDEPFVKLAPGQAEDYLTSGGSQVERARGQQGGGAAGCRTTRGCWG